jgi:RNA polymerase sigma-70 factor, ECF subfamily
MTGGDLGSFAQLLAEDAVLYADGGGKRAAALDPIRGKHNILNLFATIAAERGFLQPDQLERASINGLPGFVMRLPDGVQTTAFEAMGDKVVALYAVRNPDKLRHLVS